MTDESEFRLKRKPRQGLTKFEGVVCPRRDTVARISALADRDDRSIAATVERLLLQARRMEQNRNGRPTVGNVVSVTITLHLWWLGAYLAVGVVSWLPISWLGWRSLARPSRGPFWPPHVGRWWYPLAAIAVWPFALWEVLR